MLFVSHSSSTCHTWNSKRIFRIYSHESPQNMAVSIRLHGMIRRIQEILGSVACPSTLLWVLLDLFIKLLCCLLAISQLLKRSLLCSTPS